MQHNDLFTLRPLGGVGQIGSNMTEIRYKNRSVLIDAGMLFPWDDCFGIDYLTPDFRNLDPEPDALILTHGHEDHIGAVYQLVKRFPNIKIYCSPFLKTFLQKKHSRREISFNIELFQEGRGIPLGIDDLEVTPVFVNHSIPETYGLMIEVLSQKSCLFFTSDFKVDHHSPYEKPINFKLMNDLAKNCEKRILLADSTNIVASLDKTPSEGDLIPELDDVIGNHWGRIIATSFGSNLHRMQTFINLCQKHQRYFVPYGRSMEFYLELGLETGVLKDDCNVIKYINKIEYSNPRCLFYVSGCQGDFRSTLRRISKGEDSKVNPKDGDLILFSSKSIPGNEKKVQFLYNNFVEQGAKVLTASDRMIHVSGHAGREDLKELIETFSPTHYVPIHAESLFVKKQQEFLQESFPHIQYLELKNFTGIRLSTEVETFETEFLEPVIYQSDELQLDRQYYSERRKIAQNGVYFVSLYTKRSAFEVSVTAKGLPELSKDQFFELLQILQSHRKKISSPANQDFTRGVIRKFLHFHIGVKPEVIVQHIH